MKRRASIMILTSACGPLVAFVAMALSQAVLFGQRGMPWRGEFFWTAQWIESNSFPALIATGVALSVDAVRLFAPRRHNLVSSDDLRLPALVTYLSLITLSLAIPYFTAFAAGAAKWPEIITIAGLWSLAHAAVSLLSILTILVLVFSVAVALGSPGLAVAPMVGVALGYVAMGQNGLLLIGSSTGSMLGLEPSALSLALQFVTAIAVIAGLGVLILRWPSDDGTSSRRRYITFVCVIAAALGLSGLLGLTTPDVPTLRGELECLGTPGGRAVTSCVSYEHARLGHSLQDRFAEARAAGERYGVANSLPDAVLEDFTLTRAGLDTLPQLSSQLGTVAYWRPSVEELADPRSEISRESFAEALATPSLCPQLQAEDPPSQAFWDEVAARTDALQVMVDQTAPDANRRAAARVWARSASKFKACDFR